jgi:type IV secretion system protein VirB10
VTDVGNYGINGRRAGAAVVLIAIAGFGSYMLLKGDPVPEQEQLTTLKPAEPARVLDRGEVVETVYSPPATRFEENRRQDTVRQRTERQQTETRTGGSGRREPSAREKLDEQALQAGVGGAVNDKAAELIKAKLETYGRQSDFKPNSCSGAGLGYIRPATPIVLQIDYKVVNEQEGTVFGHVVAPVMDSRFAIEGIPDGTTFTAPYKKTESKGQKRIAIGAPTLIRPDPRNDELVVDGQMSDIEGAAGVPGDVDYPWVQAGVLVALDTAVDLGKAALSGGGSLLGSIFMDNAERPLSKAAKDMLDRAPTISLEPGEEVVLLLKSGICADDFWGR